MAKASGSSVGVEIGSRTARAVHLRKVGTGVELAGYAVEESGQFLAGTVQERGAALRGLIKKAGAVRREFGLALSGGTMFLRLLEQPETPVEVLREALRVNGPLLFNQDCRGSVMDCVPADRPVRTPGAVPGETARRRYLAGGILRTEVEALAEASRKAGLALECVQVAAVSTLNAFEQGCPEAFSGRGFLLLDLAHSGFTILAGSAGELMLLRVLEGGGRALMEELTVGGTVSEAQVLAGLNSGDREVLGRLRGCLMVLVRQVLASVGFLESRSGGEVTQIHVSGGVLGWGRLVGILAEELQMACVPWSPLGSRVALPAGAPPGLHGACGVALQLLGLPAGG